MTLTTLFRAVTGFLTALRRAPLAAPLVLLSCAITVENPSAVEETWTPTANRHGQYDNPFGGTVIFTADPATLFIPRADITIELEKVRDITPAELATHRFAEYDAEDINHYFSPLNKRDWAITRYYAYYDDGDAFTYTDSGVLYRLKAPREIRVPYGADDQPPYSNTLAYPVLHDVIVMRKSWGGGVGRRDASKDAVYIYPEQAPRERIHLHTCGEPLNGPIVFGKVRCSTIVYERFAEGVSPS